MASTKRTSTGRSSEYSDSSGPPLETCYKSSNQQVSVDLTDITGMSFSVTNGKSYYFKFSFSYASTHTGDGMLCTVTCPGSIIARVLATYSSDGTSAYNGTISSSGDTVSVSDVGNNDTQYPATIEGNFTATSDGTLQLQAARTGALAGITIYAGSCGELLEVN